MRFLADENFPGAAVALLRTNGHDVVWVTTASPGESDPEILAWAARENRILLTFDKDFGELAGNSHLPDLSVVLFRVPPPKPVEIAQRLVDAILARDDWAGHFSVIESGRVRMRRIPRREE